MATNKSNDPMKMVTARELTRSVSSYLDAAAAGESVVVTRYGRPVAMLVAAPQMPTPSWSIINGLVKHLAARELLASAHESEVKLPTDEVVDLAKDLLYEGIYDGDDEKLLAAKRLLESCDWPNDGDVQDLLADVNDALDLSAADPEDRERILAERAMMGG
jgi:prevent-host-death family protein